MIDKIKKSIGSFTWFWNSTFFIETEHGNFIWSDPEYGGDNSLVLWDGTLESFCKNNGWPFGRDKGLHIVESYCGPNIWIKS